MKKLLLVACFGVIAFSASSQAQRSLNFGGVGTGLYASYEFPVHSLISVAPLVNTDWNFNHLVLAAKGNFYFDNLFSLTDPWDVYAGINAGWRVGDDNGFNFGIHIGGRWFWNDRWGINAEFGGGTGVTGGVGLTLKM